MNSSSNDSKKFIKYFCCFFFPLTVAAIAFNFLIDPFKIHQMTLIENFNKKKVCLDTYDRYYKAIDIARDKPQAILLGSSRMMAFDPQKIENLTHLKTYNAGLRGACFEEIYHYFEHALYHQPHLKVVVMGLDFCAFNQYLSPTADFSLERLCGAPLTWRDFNASLLSINALKSSWQTFKANFNPLAAAIKENEIQAKGDLAFLKLTLRADYKNYKTDPKKVEMFRKIVEKCKEHAIELKAFFCPMQAIYWEAIYQSQLWPAYEELKRELTSIHPVWDFSGFNDITTLALQDKIGERLYHECSHFRPVVGDIIVHKMFDQTENPLNFGFFLTPQTIEITLEKMHQQAQQWLQDRGNILDQIRAANEW